MGERPVSVHRDGLVDGFGRVHRDLRVSLTDRCSLRCTYCMPAQGLPWIPRQDQLTTEELVRVIRIAADLGVTSVRLTGGEPLLRPDAVDVVAAIAALPHGLDLSLTTNGLRLPELAGPLVHAGLRRVNISLDTLDAGTFRTLTHRDALAPTLAGIAAAQRSGLSPIKINAVLLRGVNDQEAPDLLRWALEEGLQLRFIEQMPLDPQHTWRRDQMVTAAETLELLTRSGFDLEPVPVRGSSPAEEWIAGGGPGRVGIIGSITRPFCGACDRVRLTSDGHWRSCLFAHDETPLRDALRQGASDEYLAALLRRDTQAKKAGHGISDPQFLQPRRPMSAIGG